MPRTKGTPKTGGRKKGTPNRTTGAVKESIAAVVSNYMAHGKTAARFSLEKDLQDMLPAERARAITQLVGYIIPKQQAITLEEQAALEADALTQWLETAPDEAIDAIAEKVLELQERNRSKTE